jgi:hypothetical protein
MGSGLPVRFAADVDARKTLVTVKRIATVSSEPGPL